MIALKTSRLLLPEHYVGSPTLLEAYCGLRHLTAPPYGGLPYKLSRDHLLAPGEETFVCRLGTCGAFSLLLSLNCWQRKTVLIMPSYVNCNEMACICKSANSPAIRPLTAPHAISRSAGYPTNGGTVNETQPEHRQGLGKSA